MQLVILSKGRAKDVDVDAEPDSTVGDLRRAAGIDGSGLVLEGRLLSDDLRLRDSGISQGDRLVDPNDLAHVDSPPPTKAVVAVAVLSGRSAGSSIDLAAGRFVVGRAPSAALRLEDETVSPAHAELSVGADGTVSVVDLGSENGTWHETSPVAGASVNIETGDLLQFGSILLRLQDPGRPFRPAASTDRETRNGRQVLDRSPQARAQRPLPPIDPPLAPVFPSDPPPLNVAALVMPLVVGAVLALVLRNMLFVGFMLLSPLLAVGSWTQGRVRWRRSMKDYRAEQAAWEAQVRGLLDERSARETARRRSATPDIATLLSVPCFQPDRLWLRTQDDVNFGVVSLGAAALDDQPVASTERVGALQRLVATDGRPPLVPLSISCEVGAPIGVSGSPDDAAAFVRSLVIDLAVQQGPADLPMFVAATGVGAPLRWAWSKWLPHMRTDGSGRHRRLAFVAGTDIASTIRDAVATGHRPLVIIDGDDLVSGRRAELRALLDDVGPAIRMLVVARSVDRLPSTCRWIVDLNPATSTARVTDQRSDRPVTEVFVPLLSIVAAETSARALDLWEDPNDGLGGIPDSVTLDGSAALPSSSDGGLSCRLGVGADGPVIVDLVTDGPHALVAGMTGAGKSELLRSWIAGLAANHRAEQLTFLLVDYKGGSAFDVCGELPHVVGVVTDLDGDLASRMLISLRAELRHREEVLRSLAVSDVAESNESGLPRLVVVVDEFAALADELPEFLGSLVDIAQRGRSLGVHLILATQRPAGVVNDRIRANTAIRICLGVASTGDSVDVIGVPDAERFANTHPGRAIARLGGRLTPVLQTIHSTAPATDRRPEQPVVLTAFTGRCWRDEPGERSAGQDGPGPTQLAVLVDRLREQHLRRGGEAPRRPWLDPLPDIVSLDDIVDRYGSTVGEGPAVAVVDDPDRQAMFTTGWDPASGNLLIVGEPGSGRSTALASYVLSRCRAERTSPEIFVVDFTSAGHEALAARPQIGAVVRGGDDERLARLLRMIVARIEERRQGCEGPAMLVAVDGWSGWLAELEGPTAQDQFDQLGTIAAEGPAFGVHLLATDHLATSAPRLRQTFARRIVLGGRRGCEPGLGPGSTDALGAGRGFDDRLGRMVQIAHPGHVEQVTATLGRTERVDGPRAIEILPALVEPSALGRPAAATAGCGLRVAIGWSGAQLAPAHLVVHAGEHALIAGPPRSGRTTALRLLGDQVERSGLLEVATLATPRLDGFPGPVSAVDLADRLRAAPSAIDELLVLVDDAERVEDPTGVLAEILAGEHPGVRLVAAGRSDALRRSAGRWTSGLRMCRAGVLLRADRDLDGDLLGVRLPRRDIEPPSVGRGHLIVDGDIDVVQIARSATGAEHS